ncbi:hypothetical protein BIW11_04173, partial [Tropilaelaps mercedesae]
DLAEGALVVDKEIVPLRTLSKQVHKVTTPNQVQSDQKYVQRQRLAVLHSSLPR